MKRVTAVPKYTTLVPVEKPTPTFQNLCHQVKEATLGGNLACQMLLKQREELAIS